MIMGCGTNRNEFDSWITNRSHVGHLPGKSERKHISNHSIWKIARISQKYSVEVDLESGLMIGGQGDWVRKSWHDAPEFVKYVTERK
jgi:hypothetical protein